MRIEPHDFIKQFNGEMRRLGLNPHRLPGLAVGATGWDDLLTHMRALEPDASWTDVFPDTDMPEPDPELPDATARFDADPDAYWNERDIRRAIDGEFRRIVLPTLGDSDSDGAFGWNSPA